MTTVEPSMAGPMRPQDRVPLSGIAGNFAEHLIKTWKKEDSANKRATLEGSQTIHRPWRCGDRRDHLLHQHFQSVCDDRRGSGGAEGGQARAEGASLGQDLAGAGLAGRHRLSAKAGLDKPLDKLGFTLAGYGCTTCIGNSGPLPEPVAKAVTEADLVAAAVISGNRNFEGRVHPQVRANYLASPMLVVAYALAGSVNLDLTREPVGYDKKNEPVYLKDIWPSPKEISAAVAKAVKPASFKKRYGDVFKGDANWKKVKLVKGQTYQWDTTLDLCEEPALLRRHGGQAQAGKGDQGRARAGGVRRQHHHRSHLARRQHQGQRAGRPLSVRASGGAEGLQFLWLAPRQFRADGARHLRQYPHQERNDGRQGRRQHRLLQGPKRARSRPCPSSTPPSATKRTAIPRW